MNISTYLMNGFHIELIGSGTQWHDDDIRIAAEYNK